MNRKTALLAIIAVLITYGSLYPFDFAAPAGGAWQRLIAESAGSSPRGDMVGNIALFIPWGLIGMLALAARHAGLRTFGLGFILALGVQIVQIWIPSRTPALYDVVWNMVGCGVGVLLGGHFYRRRREGAEHRNPSQPPLIRGGDHRTGADAASEAALPEEGDQHRNPSQPPLVRGGDHRTGADALSEPPPDKGGWGGLQRPSTTTGFSEIAPSRSAPLQTPPLALWLLLGWVVVEWLPLVPSLDLQLIKQQLKGLLTPGILDAAEIALHGAIALLMGELIDRCWRPASSRAASAWLLPALIAAVLAGKLLLVGTQLTASAVTGYGAGIVGWWLLARASDERRSIVIVTALVLAYSISALLPFSLKATASPFDFMPFAGLLAGSMLDNARALASSLLLFFSTLYLLREGGARTMASAVFLAIWVLLLEVLQMFITGRSASITEPLLVLIAGLLLINLAAIERSVQISPAGQTPEPQPTTARQTDKLLHKALAGAIAVVLVVAGLKLVLRLPAIPYNVAELFRAKASVPALLAFALALLWIGAGAAWLGQSLARAKWPALWFAPATMLVALVSLALLWAGVTSESISDIVGSSNRYWFVINKNVWGDFWRVLFLRLDSPSLINFLETCVRYWALYTPLAAALGLMIYARAQAAGFGQRLSRAGWVTLAISAGLTLWLCKAIAFEWSSTDNLNELIAHDADWSTGLGWGGGTFLYALLVLITVNAVLVCGVRRRRPGRLVGALLATIVAIPVGWWLLNMGLDPQVEKYGQVFSGVQFLLGPDRAHALSETQLFGRWCAVQGAGTLVLAFGVWLGRSLPENRFSPSRRS